MYRSSLERKLKPAKRAWRSFTNKLQSKLHTLKMPKAIKTATQSFLTFCSRHLFIPFKKRFLTKSSHRSKYYSQSYDQNLQFQKNFAAIYIDHLYAERPLSEAHPKHKQAHAGTSRGKEVTEEKAVAENQNRSLNSIEDAWNAIVAKSPQLRCVDERAEEFIYKFHEDMKIERERSLLEFQKMLARSA